MPREESYWIALCKAACEACEVPELADQIVFEWSSRMSKTIANAGIKYGQRTIRVNQDAWPFMDESKRDETIVHEVCHHIAEYKYGREAWNHGIAWCNAMITCGYSPKVYANEGDIGEGYKQAIAHKVKGRRKTVRCGCGSHEVSTIIFNRMRKGYGYRCRTCKQKLYF